MPDEALKIVGDIGKISLRPGDVIVVRLPKKTALELYERIYRRVTSVFPGHEVLVLEETVKIEVARREDGADG